MATISIHLSTKDLLKGVEQLDSSDLEAFVKNVLQIRARKLTKSLSEKETTLLEQINIGLSKDEQNQLELFGIKSQEGTLKPLEHQKYMVLIEKMEDLNNQRLKALGKLAELKEVSLKALMLQLELLPKEA